MQRSIHYYVLSLGESTNRLYEGFRNKLIAIHDENFPFVLSNNTDNSHSKDTQIQDFLQQTHQKFDQYHEQDPLRLVVLGSERNLKIFRDLMKHQNLVNSMIEGDYTATSPHDLGMIVWPVVKEVIAGVNENAMSDLAEAVRLKQIIFGIKAVGQSIATETGSALYVEENYHLRGTLFHMDDTVVISKRVDLRTVFDDVVDIIIEKVLKMNGTVIFLPDGSLLVFEKIALIVRDQSLEGGKNVNNGKDQEILGKIKWIV